MKKTAGFLITLSLVSAGLAVPAAADETPQMVHAFDSVSPGYIVTEPNFSSGLLWGLNSTYGINEQGALDITQGSKDVVVGVIDTGITSHSDLNANVVKGYDFISNVTIAGDGNGQDSDPSDPGDYYTDSSGSYDSSWHGTHVAGIVGALANGTGALGVSPNVSIMPLRALGRSGGLLDDVIDAIVWGSGGNVPNIPKISKRVDVLNLSLGQRNIVLGAPCPSDIQAAIDGAVSRGTVVVVAAGNGVQTRLPNGQVVNVGEDLANTFPANCRNVVTVMASDSSGALTSWSNYLVTPVANSVYVTAPGLSIYSTYNTGTRGPIAETYKKQSGTSMATPFVSGLVALIRAVKPAATVAEIQSLLNDPQNKTAGVGGVQIINAGKVVQAASGLPDQQIAPEAAPTPPAEITQDPAPVVDSGPVIDPIVAPAPLTFAVKKKYTAKNFAAQSGVNVPKKSTVSLKVLAGKKACKIKSGKLATLKAGSCLVAVKVTTKVKVGKKYKNKSTTTKVNMLVA